MSRIRYLTAGESHGKALVGILEGMPAGLEISEDEINLQLQRRQMGFGRGGRMKIEKDRAEILSGVRFGKTLGSPISLVIRNKDWENWADKMDIKDRPEGFENITVPRPGHADFAGKIKYGHPDIRNVLERASARETAMRVALGAITRKILEKFDVFILSHVCQIGPAKNDESLERMIHDFSDKNAEKINALNDRADKSPVRTLSGEAEQKMIQVIETAMRKSESVGGIFEVVAVNPPVGLGSHVHWDRRLDGKIAAAMMSIPAIKSVEIGAGIGCAEKWGSEVQDELYFDEQKGYFRKTNHAGGLEGGITNGEPITIRCAMKPIPTLTKPLNSVDMKSRKSSTAFKERADVCAVPSASVIGEAVLSMVLADALCEKFGGDSVQEMYRNYQEYLNQSN